MACKCIKEVTERVINELPKNNRDYSDMKIIKADFENETLFFLDGGKTDVQLTAPMKIEYEQENKKGEVKIKKKVISFTFTYCPFCGEKYEV